jgi:cbb3-type cytochrome oxidase subunit 3
MSLALQDFPYLGLTIAALILFFVIFIGVLIWVFRPGSKRTYKQIENLPLE